MGKDENDAESIFATKLQVGLKNFSAVDLWITFFFSVPPKKGRVDRQVYLSSSAFEMQFRFSFLYIRVRTANYFLRGRMVLYCVF